MPNRVPSASSHDAVGAIVLCGGTSRRLGGDDKTAMRLGDRSILETLVASLPTDWPVVCVGDPRELSREVRWAREDPPLGGPVAGLVAGLERCPTPIVVALAGDQPFAGTTAAACVAALRDRPELDGVAARQPDGRLQPLLAAYRREPLASALNSAPHRDAGVYRTLAGLRLDGLAPLGHAVLDVDTPADLDEARRHVR